MTRVYDVIVVGGGPSGATAADDLARAGHSVALIDKAGRIKPCGGAIPPRAIADFEIPDGLLVAKIKTARMVSPSANQVDIPIEGGFVGMVDREEFDEWLRVRAAGNGATRLTGTFTKITRRDDGAVDITYRCKTRREDVTIAGRAVIGADGARSGVARQALPGSEKTPYVIAYHEIIEAPVGTAANDNGFDARRCDVYYDGRLSPDFYGWVFPHGKTVSVGMGTADKDFSLREATARIRDVAGLTGAKTIREEGAPIPLKPLKRWDDGRNVVLAGDAAGVVAPASGEGIYYAMLGGRHAAEAAHEFLATGDVRRLKLARKRFMRAHGRIFWVLGMMQKYWYCSDDRRERFVTMCRDKDVQRMTFDAYMHKRLGRPEPLKHIKIFIKDMAHLLGLAKPV